MATQFEIDDLPQRHLHDEDEQTNLHSRTTTDTTSLESECLSHDSSRSSSPCLSDSSGSSPSTPPRGILVRSGRSASIDRHVHWGSCPEYKEKSIEVASSPKFTTNTYLSLEEVQRLSNHNGKNRKKNHHKKKKKQQEKNSI